jgi:hypothetical protein
LFLLAHLGANAHNFVGDSRVQWDFLEITLDFNGFLAFCQSFYFAGTDEGVVLLWLFSQEIYIFVVWRETLVNVPSILLTIKN